MAWITCEVGTDWAKIDFYKQLVIAIRARSRSLREYDGSWTSGQPWE